MKYLLGVDNGGTVIKAAIYDLDGKEIARSTKRTEMLIPHPGYAERRLEDVWLANVEAIKEVIKESKIDSSNILGVGFTGHGNGLYPIDKDGNPSYSGIISIDTRAQSYVDKWINDGTVAKANPICFGSLWAAQPPALLSWFKDNEPEVIENTRWIMMCKDYVRYRLTGEINAEITDYSGSHTINLKTKEYDDRLFEMYDIEWAKEKMPPLIGSSDIAGYVTKEAALITGLKKNTPVSGGLFDITAGAIGVGLTTSEELCVIAGTWSINEYISDVQIESPTLFMSSIYCIPDKTLITEASPTSASNFEWFVKRLVAEDSLLNMKEAFKKVDMEIDNYEKITSDIIFLPYLYGTNSSLGSNGTFLGLRGDHTRVDMVKAIFEGVVYSHKIHIDRLMKYRNAPSRIRIAGGVINSDRWVQDFSDALQIPIEVTSTKELGALGAAMSAGVAAKAFSNFEEAAQQMVQVVKVVEPNSANKSFYDANYARFKEARKALQNFWTM